MTSTKALIRAVEDGDLKAAARLASHWHGGRHREVTALSHGVEWHHVEIQSELEELLGYAQATPEEKREADAEIHALLDFVKSHYPYVYDSNHGHRFMDHDDTGECLICGGSWDHVHTSKDDPSRGRYRANNGDDATECPGNSVIHGEGICSRHDEDFIKGCPECDHDCNCLFCA